MKPEIEYLPDNRVDNALDQDLRGLLVTCFTRPQDVVFRDRRYFREPYHHRWVIRNIQGALVAHIGAHEKVVESQGALFRMGGICEVCVHPDYRGQGYVRTMLESIHAWLCEREFVFALLFGDPLVYGSSGYAQITNLFIGGGQDGWEQVNGLARELSGTPWPDRDVHLRGPKF